MYGLHSNLGTMEDIFRVNNDDLFGNTNYPAPGPARRIELEFEVVPEENGFLYIVQGVEAFVHPVGSQSVSNNMFALYPFETVVVTAERDESQWQEEQRGFWAKIIAVLEKISNFFENFFDNLALKFVELFVPKTEDLEALHEEFMRDMTEHLGFVIQVPQILEKFWALVTPPETTEDIILTLPRAELPETFGGKVLWEDEDFNLSQMVRDIPTLKTFYGIYKVVVIVLILGLFTRFLVKMIGRVLGDRASSEDLADRDDD